MLKQARLRRGRDRAHRGRQVDQPPRVDREPAHDLQRGGGVLRAHADAPVIRGVDHAGAEHVGDVEHLGLAPPDRVVAPGASGRFVGRERPGRLVVHPRCGHGHGLPLRVAQRGQPAAEHATGVQAECVVQPLQVGHGRVAVQHHRPAAVLLRPRVPDRQAVFIGLAGRLPVQAELADSPRGPPLVALEQPGVGYDEPAAVQHVVRDQAVQEPLDVGPELRRLRAELCQRLGEPVAHLHVPPAQRPQQLVLVVAGHAECVARASHPHDQAQHAGRVLAAVDEVADEDRPPARRVRCGHRPPGLVPPDRVAEERQQLLQFRPAAVHVADHVERAGLVAPVVVQPGPDDLRGGDLLHTAQRVHAAEPLALQAPQAAPQLVMLAPDHLGAEVPVRPASVALDARLIGNVEHDGYWKHVMLARQGNQGRPGRRLHARGIDHGQPACLQPLARDEVQDLERRRRGGLVVLVVGDQAAAEVGGDDLRRTEVLAGERRLPRAGHADEHHQAQLGHAQLAGGGHGVHAARRKKTASCVGGPTSGSSGPTGR